MTGVQTCALPICFPVTIPHHVRRERGSVTQPTIQGRRKISWHPDIYTEYSGNPDPLRSYVPSFDPPPAADWTRLKQDAWADANEAAFDLLTNLAELGESVHMVRNFLSAMRGRVEIIDRIAKRRQNYVNRHDGESPPWSSRNFEQYYQIFSEVWLEVRYGWRPLVGAARDLYDAVRALSEEKDTIVVSGRAEQREALTGTAGVTWVDNTFGGWNRVSSVTGHITYRSFVSHLIRKESAIIGINPLVTAWELVPYSFVLDWFLGVGKAIQASFTPPGVSATIAGSSSKSVKNVISTSSHDPMDYTLTFGSGSLNWEQEEYVRWPDPTDPPGFSVLSNTDRMHMYQIVDLMLLAEGLLKRTFNGR